MRTLAAHALPPILASVLMAALAPAASAQDWDCTRADDLPQQGMNYCAHLDYQAADAELNAVWKEVYAAIRARDGEMSADMRGWPQALLSAQRAWIDYRDGQCAAEGFAFRGGTMEPLIVSGCKAEMTRKRTAELQALIETY